MDWNENGKKDLLSGDANGRINIFNNIGTDANPVFLLSTYLKLGLINDFDCSAYSMPEIADWNNDGKKDVLCGNYAGNVYLLLNIGTNDSPSFSSSSLIQDGSSNLNVGTYASPVVIDWNKDGKKDLLCGNYAGNILYFENKGTDNSPSFNGSVALSSGSTTIDVGSYARIEVYDWDSDGQVDLLSGNSDGYLFYYHAQNTTEASTWELY